MFKNSNWRQRKQKSCLLLLWMLKKVQLRRIAPQNIKHVYAWKRPERNWTREVGKCLFNSCERITGTWLEERTSKENYVSKATAILNVFGSQKAPSNTEQKILKTKRKKKRVKRRRQQENDFWALLNSCQTGFLLSVSLLLTRSSTFPVHLNRKEMNKMKNLLILRESRREWNAFEPL